MKENKIKRESISKRIRFEVFKRDSFTCQYCGRAAPEILLVIDHIVPVSKGGNSDILNLITACEDCNSGKSDKLLSDNSEINKKKAQLNLINEKKNQLELMYKWQSELIDLDMQAAEKANNIFEQLTGFKIVNSGLKEIKTFIKKYGFVEVVDAIKISVDQYVKIEKDGNPSVETIDYAFSKIKPILESRKRIKEKPHLLDLFYVRGILFRRGLIRNKDYKILKELESLYDSGVSIENMRTVASNCTSYYEFFQTLNISEESNE